MRTEIKALAIVAMIAMAAVVCVAWASDEADATEYTGGTLSSDGTFISVASGEESTLTASVIIPSGVTGTAVIDGTLILEEGVSIIVYGDLVIYGTGTITNDYANTGYTIGTNYGAIYVASGGSIYAYGGLTFSDIYASNPYYDVNNYDIQASAIYAVAGSSASLLNVTFSGCYSYYGSTVVIYASEDSGTVYLDSCVFKGNEGRNSASLYLDVDADTVDFFNCTFDENVGVSAGCVYAVLSDGAVLYMDASTYSNNSSTGSGVGGGAVYATLRSESQMWILNSEFLGNSAVNRGGAVYASMTGSSVMYVQYTTFDGNSASSGGALHLYEISSSIVLFDSCKFTGNSSESYGGAVTIMGTSGDYYIGFQDCTITGNSAYSYGGAVYVASYNDNYGSITVNFSACTVTGNTSERATEYACIYADSSTVDLYVGSCVLTYDANGGKYPPSAVGGENEIDYILNSSGSTYSDYNCFLVSFVEPSLDGMMLLGWSTDAEAEEAEYEAWDTIVVTEDTTLYAVWTTIDASAATIDIDGLEDGALIITQYDTATLEVSVSELKNITYTLSWAAADESIVTISASSDGATLDVYGLAIGETTLTLTLTLDNTGSYTTVEIPVTVEPVLVEYIVISGSTTINVGDSTTLRAVTYPTNAEVRTISWSVESEDEGVAAYTITETTTGSWITLTGQIAGTLTVTATADDESGTTATVTLIISSLDATATVTISGVSTLAVGSTQTYTATVLPTSIEDRTVAWTITAGEDLVEYTITETEYGGAISITGLSDGQVTLLATYSENGEVVAQASYNVAVISYSYSESVADVGGSLLDSLSDWLGDNSDAASIAIIAVIILALLALLESKWLAFLVGIPVAVVLSALGLLEGDIAAIVCVIAAAGVALTASGIFAGGRKS